jgi:hypothetical protein
MEEKGYDEYLHMAAQEEDNVYNEEEHITSGEAQVNDMFYQVICCAHILCSSCQIICPQCMCVWHFRFQCSNTYYGSVASFYSNDDNRELVECVLYEGADELLRKIMILMMSSDDEFLQMAYKTLKYIVESCHEHLSDNALVIKSKEQCKLVFPENNHLQDSQDKEEEHQEGEVDNELHITNSMIVNDGYLLSNYSCNAKTEHNLYVEALRLDTHEESITNDELEIEPCYESSDANMREFPIAKEEYYEVFPSNGNQGKILKIIFQYPIFSL